MNSICALLMIGYLNMATEMVTPIDELSNIGYTTVSQCEQAKRHPQLIATYKPIVEEQYAQSKYRAWCEPVMCTFISPRKLKDVD